jgi:hypothetical protein
MSIHAKCIVPSELRKYSWPEFFEVLPRAGEQIRSSTEGGPCAVVTNIVHTGSSKADVFIELHCVEAKDILLG